MTHLVGQSTDRRRSRRVQHVQREFERQQAAAQKEFDEFVKWAEVVMEAGSEMETNDFLTKEFAASPKRWTKRK